MIASTSDSMINLTLAIPSGIRRPITISNNISKLSLDTHLCISDSCQGMFFNTCKILDIERVAAPIYFKYKLNMSEDYIHKPLINKKKWREKWLSPGTQKG